MPVVLLLSYSLSRSAKAESCFVGRRSSSVPQWMLFPLELQRNSSESTNLSNSHDVGDAGRVMARKLH